MKSENAIAKNTAIQSAYAIAINPAAISQAAYNFIRAYNTNQMKADKIEANNNQLFQSIGKHNIPAQVTIILSVADFKDKSTKQTFKVSCQRFYARTFQGYALVVAGNIATSYALLPNQTTDIKGKVIDLSAQATKQEAAKLEAERKAALLTEAEQTKQRLEGERIAREQAEATAATLVKKQNDHDKEIKQVESKAKTAAELMAQEIADLKNQLERARHETSATIAEYQRLKTMIMGKTTLAELRASVSGIKLAVNA
jgi:hypothetical protein